MVKSPKNTRQHKESRKQVKKTEASVKWIYILLFSLACLLYANTLRHEYAFDDAVAITENAFTQKGIQGIPDLFQKDLFAGIHGKDLVLGGGRWRPLSLITFALEVQFFGNNPHISHLFNVLLYGLAVVILFMMLQKILPGKLLLNFLVTLLFIVHPVHTEVVANIKSRDELLSFIGLCLAIYWCFKFIESRRMKYLMYSCIAYILALTSKENGITLIALLPILLVYLANKKWKESILTTTPYLAVAAIYLFIRWKMVGLASDKITSIIDNPFLDATVFEKYATIMAILGKYLLLLLVVVTPPVLFYLWRSPAKFIKTIKEDGKGLFLVLFLVPILLFLLIALGKTVGGHWILSFYPFLFVALAVFLNYGQLRVCFHFMWGSSLIFLIAFIVLILAIPNAFKHNPETYQDLIFATRTSALLEAIKPFQFNFQLATTSYSQSSVLAYWSKKPVMVLGLGSHHGRQDDMLTDLRKLHRQPIMLISQDAADVQNHAKYFGSYEHIILPFEGTQFHLGVGTDFNYPLYRDTILVNIRQQYYAMPSWLPKGQCYMDDRYGAVAPKP